MIDRELLTQAMTKVAEQPPLGTTANGTQDLAGAARGLGKYGPAAAGVASLLSLLPGAGAIAGAGAGLYHAPQGRLLPGLNRGIHTGATTGAGAALGGAVGGVGSGLLAHLLGASPETAAKVGVGGAAVGAGAGGYGGHRLGKYLNWDDMGTETQPKKKVKPAVKEASVLRLILGT